MSFLTLNDDKNPIKYDNDVGKKKSILLYKAYKI